jgi:arylsulfatase A-like enzyme
MIRTSTLPLAMAVLACLATLTPAAQEPLRSAPAPNVLIFYLDDMGWGQPSCYGGRLVPTPAMDAIAANGVRFAEGYSSGCICSPGRVGLMTGRYQARSGHDANATGPGRELLLSEKIMPQYLKEAGYATGILGKWHLGMTAPEYYPTARGFDVALGTVGNLGEGKGPAFYRGAELVDEFPGAPITSPRYAAEACRFLEDHRQRPFLLYLSFNAVHSPVVASPKWLSRFAELPEREQAYAALVAEADQAIGTVMDKLRDLQLEENTLVFCISDNGGASPLAEQLGLRGRKWTVWEGGIRVTWMVQWKGRFPPGRVTHEPVIQLDVLPTILDACAPGSSIPQALDGVNLLPLLEGKTTQVDRQALFFRFGVQYAIRQRDWKLVKASQAMQPMLVNLSQDPSETTDLSTTYPQKTTELQQLWDQWNSAMLPPRWEDRRWNDGNLSPPAERRKAKRSRDEIRQ